MSEFDLVKYWRGFDDALRGRYHGKDFEAGREAIRNLYKDVTSGSRGLTIADVMAIFDSDLPFIEDWTKPEPHDLAKRMESRGVAASIALLPGRGYYDSTLLEGIIYCFREVSLTALVLQHVYPTHFAMCSHFLASQLHIRGDDSPGFYLKYCKELKEWSDHKWPKGGKLTVVEAEYALWTWYRLAYKDENSKQRRRLKKEFHSDRWVQERRALQIAESLNWGGRLDLARSYINVDPTVAAIIAWREFDVTLGIILRGLGIKTAGEELTVPQRILLLSPDLIPPRWDKKALKSIWCHLNYAHNELSDRWSRTADAVRG